MLKANCHLPCSDWPMLEQSCPFVTFLAKSSIKWPCVLLSFSNVPCLCFGVIFLFMQLLFSKSSAAAQDAHSSEYNFNDVLYLYCVSVTLFILSHATNEQLDTENCIFAMSNQIIHLDDLIYYTSYNFWLPWVNISMKTSSKQ